MYLSKVESYLCNIEKILWVDSVQFMKMKQENSLMKIENYQTKEV